MGGGVVFDTLRMEKYCLVIKILFVKLCSSIPIVWSKAGLIHKKIVMHMRMCFLYFFGIYTLTKHIQILLSVNFAGKTSFDHVDFFLVLNFVLYIKDWDQKLFHIGCEGLWFANILNYFWFWINNTQLWRALLSWLWPVVHILVLHWLYMRCKTILLG